MAGSGDREQIADDGRSLVDGMLRPGANLGVGAEIKNSALGLTSKSKERTRRPTLPELDALMTYFGESKRRHPESIPKQAPIAFAIF